MGPQYRWGITKPQQAAGYSLADELGQSHTPRRKVVPFVEIVHHCTAPLSNLKPWFLSCDCDRSRIGACICGQEWNGVRTDDVQIRITAACCWQTRISPLP